MLLPKEGKGVKCIRLNRSTHTNGMIYPYNRSALGLWQERLCMTNSESPLRVWKVKIARTYFEMLLTIVCKVMQETHLKI